MIDIIATIQTFLTANFLHANVAGISAIPTMLSIEDYPDNSNATERVNGLFVYLDVTRSSIPVTEKETEIYLVNYIVAMPTRTAFTQSMIELARIFLANNNNTIQPTEYYNIQPKETFELEDFKGEFTITVDRFHV